MKFFRSPLGIFALVVISIASIVGIAAALQPKQVSPPVCPRLQQ
jgi:hypothetical protein